MATLIGSLTRPAYRNNKKLNILCMPTHERYQTTLAKTGHEFYLWQGDNIKSWNTRYAALPSNYHMLNATLADRQIPLDLDLDLILSQNKFGQYQVASRLAVELHLPLINLEHTLPPPGRLDMVSAYRQMRGNINVFISEFNRDAWGWEPSAEGVEVIHHGIDTYTFCPPPEGVKRNNVILSVVNDFANREIWCGFNLWKTTIENLPYRLVGDNPGLSDSAQSTEELINIYQKSKIFLNTSLVSPIPTSLLEAASCGCAIISTATCMIPEIIKHGENGLLANHPDELRDYAVELLNNDALARKLGEAARQTVIEKFSARSFINNWNRLFEKASQMFYTGEI